MLAFVFVAGCALGSLLYLFIAETPLAHSQEALADTLGDAVHLVRHRLGFAAARPTRLRQRPLAHPEEDAGEYYPAEPARREADPYHQAPPAAAEAREWEPAHAEVEAYEDPPVAQVHPDADWGEVTAGIGHREQVAHDEHWHNGEAWDEADVAPVAPPSADDRPPPAVLPPPEPPPAPEPPVVEELPAMRPAGLTAPRNGVPDDLQRIRGIGKKNEELLNSLGIFHFGQIAAWTPAEVRWVGIQIKFPERIERDDWIGQATILASGGRTGYIKAEDRKRLAQEEADRPPGIEPD